MKKVSLEQKIDLAWYKKTGQMPAGWTHWVNLTATTGDKWSEEFTRTLAEEFGVTIRTISRWHYEYKKVAANG